MNSYLCLDLEYWLRSFFRERYQELVFDENKETVIFPNFRSRPPSSLDSE